MKSAYKWRITNTKYVYITDEHNYGPFIYDKATHIREYEGGIEESVTNDGLIADVVSEFTLEEYTERFNQMKNLTKTDEEASRVKFLDISYYYDFNNDECVVKATEAECEGYAPVINVETESLPPTQEPTADVKVVYSDVDKTVHYEVKLGIPKGEKGEQGGAGSGSTIQISMDPKVGVIEEYKNAAHLQYIEPVDDPANLYSTLHIAPVLNKNVIDEQSCVKNGQEVSVVETAKLFIDYDDVETKNNFKMGGNAIIGGNLTTNGTSILNGATVINSTLNVTNQITGESGLIITNGGANITGNTTISQNLTVEGDTTLHKITVDGDTYFGGNVTFSQTTIQTLTNDFSCPIGTIVMWPSGNEPKNWTLCTGTTIADLRFAESGEAADTSALNYEYQHMLGVVFSGSASQADIIIEKFEAPFVYRPEVLHYNNGGAPKDYKGIVKIQYHHRGTPNTTEVFIGRTNNNTNYFNIHCTRDGWYYQIVSGNTTYTCNNTSSIRPIFGTKMEKAYINETITQKDFTNLLTSNVLSPIHDSSDKILYQIPDFRSRFPRGKDTIYGELTTGGATGTTLSINNIPQHKHTVNLTTNQDAHSHQIHSYQGDGTAELDKIVGGGYGDDAWINTTSYSHRHTITGNTGEVGLGTPFSIIPPYLSINFIMKYK